MTVFFSTNIIRDIRDKYELCREGKGGKFSDKETMYLMRGKTEKEKEENI